ncbi:MAG: putative zinc-binding metallopeptidase [Carboxylicivirga sp.]|jgi:substrate import-associated zinc metallohydrolase lipoprotein|nr:putative zinc-binding metallopeptidase [Carboxylicivirga sp.]
MIRDKIIIVFLLFAGLFWACEQEEDVNYIKEVVEESTDEIDVYFRTNYLTPYGTAVRWKWDDKLVDNSKKVTPVKRELCIPMGEFVKKFWLEPFQVTQSGTDFMKEHFPPEIVLIGSPMYNADGISVTLGYADAGVRITFTQVNELDLKDKKWLLMQLRTAEHEYAHIVHQKHDLPNGFKQVSPANYRSTNWMNMAGDVQSTSPKISREAISLGMVTDYGSSSDNEDFCEVVSMYLTSSPDEFKERYITHEPETEEDGKKPAPNAALVNRGRDLIAIKLNMVKKYYKDKFDIDLDVVRDEILKRINEELNKDE